jgi:hypothetical protein
VQRQTTAHGGCNDQIRWNFPHQPGASLRYRIIQPGAQRDAESAWLDLDLTED